MPTPPADSTVDQLRALLAKATPNLPWKWKGIQSEDDTYERVFGKHHRVADLHRGPDDAALIVAAVNALPKLLAVVEAAEAVSAENDGYGTRALHALREALASLDAGSE